MLCLKHSAGVLSQEPFKQETGYLAAGATEGSGGVFSQSKSDTVFLSTLTRRRYMMISPPSKVYSVHTLVPIAMVWNTLNRSQVISIKLFTKVKNFYYLCYDPVGQFLRNFMQNQGNELIKFRNQVEKPGILIRYNKHLRKTFKAFPKQGTT